MSQVNTLKEIALSRAIDGQLNEIVQKAGKLAAQLQGSSMRENQLRNVLEVALHTESIEVVGNFIRYQIGRGSGWKTGNFGENVITALDAKGPVYQHARNAASAVIRQMEEAKIQGKLGQEPLPDRAVLIQEAHIKLTRLFLGYLNRWFLYADREKAWGKIEPMLKSPQEAAT
jgi:hypothetical protein